MQLHNLCDSMNLRYALHMAEPRYVSANLKPDTATHLRRVVAELTLMRGRRVTTSEVIDAALAYAEHRPEAFEPIP